MRRMFACLLLATVPSVVVMTSPGVGAVNAGADRHISPDAGLTRVVINEVAPSGRGATDEFFELHNTSDEAVRLADWELAVCVAPEKGPVLLLVFSTADVIGPGGYLLVAHFDSRLAHLADLGYDGIDMPEDGGWLLIDRWTGFTEGVGLATGLDCTEGEPAPECDWVAGEALTRDPRGTDTDDNSTDFTCKQLTPGF